MEGEHRAVRHPHHLLGHAADEHVINPVRPWVDMTIRSQPSSLAFWMISTKGTPLAAAVSAFEALGPGPAAFS